MWFLACYVSSATLWNVSVGTFPSFRRERHFCGTRTYRRHAKISKASIAIRPFVLEVLP